MAKGRGKGRRKGRKGSKGARARKGRKGSKGRKARKSKKPKARKSSKRSRAAKKAARTRAEKKAKRSAAAKKAARSRKRKGGGKRRKARKAKEGGKRRGKDKRRGKKRQPTPAQIGAAGYRTVQKFERDMNRLKAKHAQAEKRLAAAKVAAKGRKTKQADRLEKHVQRLNKQIEKLRAAEEARRHRRRHGRKGGARENPISMGEGGWAVLGVLVGGAATVVSDRFAASHPLVPITAGQGGASGFTDAPVQGDVPDVSAASLPMWANFKLSGWKRLLAAAANIGVPLFAARYVQHEGGKTFLQLWGFTALGITGAKVTTDLATMAVGKTKIGMRLYAPEMSAKSVQKMSAQQLLPAISVAPGLGLVGLVGYGRDSVGAAGCGNCGNCDQCKANTLGQFPPGACGPTTGTPQPGGSPTRGATTGPVGTPTAAGNGGNAAPAAASIALGAAGVPRADTSIDRTAGSGRKNITAPANVREIGTGAKRGRGPMPGMKKRTWG